MLCLVQFGNGWIQHNAGLFRGFHLQPRSGCLDGQNRQQHQGHGHHDWNICFYYCRFSGDILVVLQTFVRNFAPKIVCQLQGIKENRFLKTWLHQNSLKRFSSSSAFRSSAGMTFKKDGCCSMAYSTFSTICSIVSLS